eukprot:symbB.v1.2.025844.t1/scaffold2495.1/size77801/5
MSFVVTSCQVLERLPEAPTLLLVGFSTDRSPLFLGSTSSSIGFDSKGSCCSKDTATAAPDDASRIGVLLDQEVGEGRVSVFLDGQQIGSTAIPRLHGKALFPTLTFQNVTLAVNFQSPGPERSHAFGWIAQEHLVRSSCLEALEVLNIFRSSFRDSLGFCWLVSCDVVGCFF